MKKPLHALLIGTALTLGAASAFSQGMMGSEGHGGPRGEMRHGRMEEMAARHLESLKVRLKLSAAQEAAWNSFAAAMKPGAASMPQRPDRAELDKLSTPERVDRLRALRRQQHEAMEAAADKRDEAIKTFYATLSPEQKKTFDSEHARIGQRDERGSGRHGSHSKGQQGDKPPAKP